MSAGVGLAGLSLGCVTGWACGWNESVPRDVAYDIRRDRVKGGANNAADQWNRLSKIDRALLAKFREQAEAHRLVDLRDGLTADVLDGIFRKLSSDNDANVLQDILGGISGQACICHRLDSIIPYVVLADVCDGMQSCAVERTLRSQYSRER